MKHLAPRIARDFVCAAAACPDSCCRSGWQIVVDEAALSRYAALPGALGERARAGLCPGEDGETLLRMKEGVCVLLDGDGLCALQRACGHEALCRVCRDYPRFTRYFGNLTEHGLSLSCPEALRLAAQAPPTLVEWEDDAPIVPNELDPGRYLPLRRGRAEAFALLEDESLPARERLRGVLQLAAELQQQLKPRRGRRSRQAEKPPLDSAGPLPAQCIDSPVGRDHAPPQGRGRSLHCPEGNPESGSACRRMDGSSRCAGMIHPYGDTDAPPEETLRQWAGYFLKLEILSPAWAALLRDFIVRPEGAASDGRPMAAPTRGARRAQATRPTGGAVPVPCSLLPVPCDCRPTDALYVRWTWYHLYKYWLDAEADALLLPRVRRALVCMLLGRALDMAFPAALPHLQALSKELEHCEENLTALLRAMEREPCFAPQRILSVLDHLF